MLQYVRYRTCKDKTASPWGSPLSAAPGVDSSSHCSRLHPSRWASRKLYEDSAGGKAPTLETVPSPAAPAAEAPASTGGGARKGSQVSRLCTPLSTPV